MSDVPEGQYVTFSLNDEEYALNALNVQEIIELTQITRIPHLPESLKGVINLRGAIIPVLDLKQKFGMKADSDRTHTCVIVTEYSQGVRGIIVDAVLDVLPVPEGSVSSPPSFGPRIKTDFLRGMGRAGDRILLILDIEALLTGEEPLMTTAAVNEQGMTATDTHNEKEAIP